MKFHQSKYLYLLFGLGFIILLSICLAKPQPENISDEMRTKLNFNGTFSDQQYIVSFSYDEKKCNLYFPNVNEQVLTEFIDPNIALFDSYTLGECICFYSQEQIQIVRLKDKTLLVTLSKTDDLVVQVNP